MSEFYTKHFSNCKAVFQGGGCKGIAYVGAYKRAYSRGVFFTELAGTSAGSIIAALIAAGAKPNQLEEIIRKTDFKRFVRRTSHPSLIERVFIWLFAPKGVKKFSNHVSLTGLKNNYGLFDSQVIESFVEDALFTISGKKNITFEELIPDLHVICSDTRTHTIKIWDKTNTPKAIVSKAVRTSCSIPLFFTPVDNRYVDGGMLSNLPNFVFSDDPHYNKILCFRNEGVNAITEKSSFLGYLSSLVETIIDGAGNLQKQFSKGTHEIVINTGEIRSTDFSKVQDSAVIDKLIRCGEEAMDAFLDSEDIQNSFSVSNARTVFHTEEQMHSMVSELSADNYDKIYVCRDNTYWSWILFLSVVKWINAGTDVQIVVNRTVGDNFKEEERSRRRMLQAMGCQVDERDVIPVKGFFFYKKGIWTGVVYEKNENGFEGRMYGGAIDQPLLINLINSYQLPEHKQERSITILECPEEELLKKLRNVPEYKDADLRFEVIKLDDIYFMNPMIRALKYRQIQLMFDLYGGQDISKFSSAALVFPNGKESIIGPPVVERHNGVNYLIEGNTRCIFAFRHGVKELKVVVAEGVKTPLPCSKDEKYRIDQVLISDRKLEGENRYNGFARGYFRHIEANLRPAETYML